MTRDEIKNFITPLLATMSNDALTINRTLTITMISLELKNKWPRMMRESRRAIAARYITAEIKRRGL